MRNLNVLICGADELAMQEIAAVLVDDGVTVEISNHPIDALDSNTRKWDFLLIDLDGMNSFLRSLIPAICHRFPKLPVIGISTQTSDTSLGNGIKLHAFLNKVPRAEDLIVMAPGIASKYLCDTGTLREIKTGPLPIVKTGPLPEVKTGPLPNH